MVGKPRARRRRENDFVFTSPWRDCANARCRRARKCLVPYPCYWNRKQAMTPAHWARAEAACRPLRALLSLGSLKGSEGLWQF
jgi:hypothetical protein